MAVAAMMSVWKELSERYTDEVDAPDEALASVMLDQAIALLLNKYDMDLPPYRTPCAVTMQLINKN